MLDAIERSQEDVLVGVPAQEPQDDLPPRLHDERRNPDEGIDELLELHAQKRLLLRLVLFPPASRLGEPQRTPGTLVQGLGLYPRQAALGIG